MAKVEKGDCKMILEILMSLSTMTPDSLLTCDRQTKICTKIESREEDLLDKPNVYMLLTPSVNSGDGDYKIIDSLKNDEYLEKQAN